MDSRTLLVRRLVPAVGIALSAVLTLSASASAPRLASLPTTPAWFVQLNQPSSSFGASVAGAGDLDGDGFDDFVVSAPSYDTATYSDAGAVFVYGGSATGPSLAYGWTRSGTNSSGSRFGSAVAGAGDVNGDGFADLLIGEPYFTQGQSREGRALLYLGSASGLRALPAWSVQSDQTEAEMGKVLAGAGDVNGDGFDDVVVASPAYNLGTGLFDNGIVHVYHGSASGLSTTPALTIAGDVAGLFFGESVAGAGDVNGDGFDDVLVGTVNYHSGTVSWAGRAYLFLGAASGLSATAAWTFTGATNSSGLSRSVAGAGDVNGDGYADVLVGADHNDNGNVGPGGAPLHEGTVFLFLGGPSGLPAAPDWSVAGSQDQERFGVSVAGAGDVNGDGYGDIAVGSLTFNNPVVTGTNEGAAFLYLGSPTTPAATPAWSVVGTMAGGTFGASVSGAGDPDGDGLDNLLVGWPGYSDGQLNEGAAALYFGPSVPITCIDQDDDGYGDPGDPSCSNGAARDCDDASASTWPGAPETCNSVDDNCNASIDEGYPLGQECLVGIGLCTRTGSKVCAPSGTTTICGNVTPGEPAPETCDGFDNDCDAQVDEGLADPDACRIVASPVPVARLGNSIASGDMNGDGFWDLLIGVPGAAVQTGQVRMLRGAGSGLHHDPFWVADAPDPAPNTWFGWSVAAVGDVDRDGFSDFLVGAPGFDHDQYGQDARGAAYFYRGSASAPILAGFSQGAIRGERYGGVVAPAGDLDDDRFADVVIVAGGKPFDNPGYVTRAYVLAGSRSGLSGVPTWTFLAPSAQVSIASAAGAGDVNGDGFDDLIIGSIPTTYPTSQPGMAALYLGGRSGPAPAPVWTGQGQFAEPYYGRMVAAAGDVNGDGFADILVGAPGTSVPGSSQAGSVYLYLGSSQGPATTPSWVAISSNTDDAFGMTAVSAGDVNADGFGDFLVGAPYYDDDHQDEGRVYLYLGGAAGPGTNPVWSSSPSDQEHAFSGYSLAAVGAVGGNGVPEIAIASPWFDSGGSPAAGRVDLIRTLDLDADGVSGSSDNCPYAANPSQSDADADGLGDICDCAPTVPGALPPGPVTGTLQSGHGPSPGSSFVSWSQPAGATHSNTYRGTIPAGLMGSRTGAFYDHACYESADAGGDGPLTSSDAIIPAAGTAYYYLVSGENGCGEGPLDAASNGVPRPLLSACPSPP